MKNKIIARNNQHLKELIQEEIQLNGSGCDLNHIDVSKITNMDFIFAHKNFNGDISQWDVSNVVDMSHMFCDSQFNGDISEWNVSNVEKMSHMFHGSQFNGDISKWNVSKVKEMNSMFESSQFNEDISKWDVSNLTNMFSMFKKSQFNQDISNWKPYSARIIIDTFLNCPAPVPYWNNIKDQEIRNKAIDVYHLSIQLNEDLANNSCYKKKMKI